MGSDGWMVKGDWMMKGGLMVYGGRDKHHQG